MREILFRGKRVDNGEWVYGSLLNPYRKKPLIAHYENGQEILGYTVEVIPDTVGQYTGVTDKNDKKIFEHDIVRIAVGGIYANHVVSYDKENARFVVGDIDFTMVRIFSPKIEVIGIHDNPELLEGEDNG